MKRFLGSIWKAIKSGIKWALICLGIFSLLGMVGGTFFYFFWPQILSWQIWTKMLNLPDFSTFEEYRPYQTAYFFSRENEIVGCVAEEWRDKINPKTISVHELLIAKIVLSVEDRRFYERDLAIDVRGIGRAFFEDIVASIKARRIKIVEGGSSIPQQLVKQLLPKEEREARSITRKFKELVLASRLVTKFSKDEILALYLNEVAMGHNRYGVRAASLFYFGKEATEFLSDSATDIAEAATLAGVIKLPQPSSPVNHPETAKTQRDGALGKAFETGILTEALYKKALLEPIKTTVEFSKACNRAPYAVDYARGILAAEHGIFFDKQGDKPGKNQAWFGLNVFLTVSGEIQKLATEGVALTLAAYKERQKEKAIDAESAFLAIENGTGAILALVGGSDYTKTKFNHATQDCKKNSQACRQNGSAFKPVVYTARFQAQLEDGKPYTYLLDQTLSNATIKCRNQWDPKTKQWTYWIPRNFDEKKFGGGRYPARFAIAQSINRPAVWAAQLGYCQLDPRVLTMAGKLGIGGVLDPTLPTALGSSGVSLLELTRAYSVYPNRGALMPTYIISRITDADDHILYEKKEWNAQKECKFLKRVPVRNKYGTIVEYKVIEAVEKCGISEILAGVMVEALRGTVKFGTAHSLSSLPQPAACKTGTTENYIDAWLICFTPHLTMGTWMGGAEGYNKPLGDKETGAKTIPAIRHVLENWYKDKEPTEFQEISEDYMKALVNPLNAQKEIDLLKNIDDAEAPSEE